jgi:hypothetical protein
MISRPSTRPVGLQNLITRFFLVHLSHFSCIIEQTNSQLVPDAWQREQVEPRTGRPFSSALQVIWTQPVHQVSARPSKSKNFPNFRPPGPAVNHRISRPGRFSTLYSYEQSFPCTPGKRSIDRSSGLRAHARSVASGK